MIERDGFACLFDRVIDTIAIVASTFVDHTLFVNDKPGKSESMVHITVKTKVARLYVSQRGPLEVHYGRVKFLPVVHQLFIAGTVSIGDSPVVLPQIPQCDCPCQSQCWVHSALLC